MSLHRSASRWLLLALVVASLSASSFAQIGVGIGISVRIGPPALPVYAQPICPASGMLWTPGYWGWNDDGGYYWVPGTWVVAPVGMLWTPGYWGFAGGFYGWHGGYWGPHIGFYGGINYGFGYGGVGFAGGEWRGGGFYYNRSVTNVSVTNVTNVYNKTVIVNNTTTTSFNGEGGVKAEPTPQEEAAAHEQHTPPLAAQTQHETLAAQNKQNFASENHGRPAIAATSKPGDFSAKSAVPSRAAGAEYHAPAISPKEARVATPASPNGAKPAGGASTPEKNGFRPFTPPNNTGSQNKPAATPSNENKGATGNNSMEKPANSAPPKNNNPPKAQGHKPAPPPKKNSPPPKDERKGKGR
jgi:hypothetical protein